MKRWALSVLVAAAHCATLAEPAGGDQGLPTSGAGPFRKLTATELAGAPYVLDDAPALYREPAALAIADGVALYVVMHDAQGSDVIARTRANDGRSFFGATLDVGHKPQKVLAADQSWEGVDLGHPSVLAVGSEVWLYYAANGSIGLARGSDGLSFTKEAAPVLAADSLGPITSASVARFPDGSFHMMLARGDSIYEAVSADGTAWPRPSVDAVLSPAPSKTTLALGEVPPFDTLRVADPCLVPRTTAAGRLQVRVLYAGFAQGDAGLTSAIGFAARYGEATAPLVRAAGAVYTVGKHENAPALFEQPAWSLLYVEQDQTSITGPSYRALAGAVSPPTITLPSASPYPPSP